MGFLKIVQKFIPILGQKETRKINRLMSASVTFLRTGETNFEEMKQSLPMMNHHLVILIMQSQGGVKYLNQGMVETEDMTEQ